MFWHAWSQIATISYASLAVSKPELAAALRCLSAHLSMVKMVRKTKSTATLMWSNYAGDMRYYFVNFQSDARRESDLDLPDLPKQARV